jgi:hypothetical protein
MLFMVSCKKDHYNVGNVHGVNAEGEMLLPVGSASFSVAELMQQFSIDDIITYMEDGTLTYSTHFEDFGVVNGENLLRFKDLEFNERFSLEALPSIVLPYAIDTMFHFEQT